MIENLPMVWFIIDFSNNRDRPNTSSVDTVNPEALIAKYIHNPLTTSPATTLAQDSTTCSLDFCSDLPDTACDPLQHFIKTGAWGFLLKQN